MGKSLNEKSILKELGVSDVGEITDEMFPKLTELLPQTDIGAALKIIEGLPEFSKM